MSGVSGEDNGTSTSHTTINHDYNNSEKNNYTMRPPTFSGDSTEFGWWKSNMYNHIIGLDDELWDILKYDIDISVNGVGMTYDRKALTPYR